MKTIKVLVFDNKLEEMDLVIFTNNKDLSDFVMHLDEERYEVKDIEYIYARFEKYLKRFYKKSELEMGGNNVK